MGQRSIILVLPEFTSDYFVGIGILVMGSQVHHPSSPAVYF